MNWNATEKLLASEGWSVNCKQLSDFMGKDVTSIDDVEKLKQLLLDIDIREYSSPVLANQINKELGEFKGPLVLQVVKLRNVSYPKYSDATHTDGLIKIQLSDGFSNIQALQIEPIPKLNSKTPFGAKVRLTGKIPIENGMLLIDETNCHLLGGVVEKVVEKWNLEKNWLQNPLRIAETKAPKWVQFSTQRVSEFPLSNSATNKLVQTNDVINGFCKNENEQTDDFSIARKAQIEQVIENNDVKEFAESQIKPKHEENAASTSYNSTSKKEAVMKSKSNVEHNNNRNRRFSRDNKRSMVQVCRPSNLPTLFDFVQSKVSIPKLSNEQDSHGNVQSVKMHEKSRHPESPTISRPGRNKSSLNQQTDGDRNGLRTSKISSSSRYRKNFNLKSGCDSNYAVNAVKDNFHTNYADDFSAVAVTNEEFARMHISLADNQLGNINKDYLVSHSGASFEYENSTNHELGYQSVNGLQHQRSFDNLVMKEEMPCWKIGDKCLAPWSDGQFYLSTLVSMGPADMCTVEYDEYGNRSSVPIEVLLSLQTF
ncbi:unnamed protein product [Thelazia callipaeda]|uniref:Tudor domain-containing protein n=1 Tax=Thelazia callipaeda TaxID=103827 RepID=A0A0N5D9C8_THECL|nr:unnamed protein product [Thelazia callipaeda]